MKNSIRALAALLLAGATGVATAADFPRGGGSPYYAPTPMVYNWAGFYVGGNIGYQWGKVTNSSINPSGVAGGVQAGYNWQNGQFVFGAETDLQLSGADDTFAPYKFSNPWFGTLRGRIGYSFNNIMPYVTGGLAYGNVKSENGNLSENKTQLGWTLGLGAEVGLTQNWSAKVEYLYMDLGQRHYSITNTDNAFQSSVFRVGVNYHF
ncbi:porin family protein [Pseudolabrys taiwanensis]|uniref:Porin family protein n=1 Tax=Pseudolabrys taiwanensis TaxID=331696 RepID=A0A346A252_9HYPH|nr:outer membrane protein [Pseudolabrys taiwanensis]AXK83249.1 porin family protein [Pseudolabrys taiwanensis]